MPTSRNRKWTVSTNWNIRESFTIWIDYLFGNNWWTNQIVEDETGEEISIYANSGYESIQNDTQRTKRTSI